MSTETNKAAVRRYHDAFSAGDLDAVTAEFAPNAVVHTSSAPHPLTMEDFKQFGGVFLNAFPDGKTIVEDVIGEADKVVSRIIFRGTHTGELMGIPPTGKTVTVSEMIIDQFAEGRIVKSWRLLDQMVMMQQLGVIPTPGQSGR